MRVYVYPHLIWQTTKSYVERGNAFGLLSHQDSLRVRTDPSDTL
jgi:hypothetical protein